MRIPRLPAVLPADLLYWSSSLYSRGVSPPTCVGSSGGHGPSRMGGSRISTPKSVLLPGARRVPVTSPGLGRERSRTMGSREPRGTCGSPPHHASPRSGRAPAARPVGPRADAGYPVPTLPLGSRGELRVAALQASARPRLQDATVAAILKRAERWLVRGSVRVELPDEVRYRPRIFARPQAHEWVLSGGRVYPWDA